MDKLQYNQLIAAGVDVDDALGRFMGNEELMLRFLLYFPQDPSFPQLKEALDRNDAEAAFEAAHALKGVAGNLSLKGLYQSVSALVEDLRSDDLAAAAGRMPQLEVRYQEMIQVLLALA